MNEEPEIKHFKTDSTGVPYEPYLPGAEAAQIWLALHKKQEDAIFCGVDPLQDIERNLYAQLTEKFAIDVSLHGFHYNVLKPEEP